MYPHKVVGLLAHGLCASSTADLRRPCVGNRHIIVSWSLFCAPRGWLLFGLNDTGEHVFLGTVRWKPFDSGALSLLFAVLCFVFWR